MDNDNDNKRPKTLADILREMRTILSVVPEGGGDAHIPKHWLEEWADRIEAAVGRERDATPGNAAAMREALKYAREVLALNGFVEPVVRCDAALAAPARNIDRFATEGEAWKFYLDHVPDNGNLVTGYAEWLFATELIYGDAAAEGGAECEH